jgi:photosystem II stability/assembly factor-like uncharacterized protein
LSLARSQGVWIALCLLCRAFGQDPESQLTFAPFTLTWLEGKCPGCKIAADLTEVQWVNRNEAWAIGMSVPPQGALDYSIVHTTDSGRSWKELPNSWQHAGPPAFTFLDAGHGWYSCWTVYCGGIVAQKVFRSTDGGKHWRLISRDGVVKMVFADANQGIGESFGVDDCGDVVRTIDGGRTWSKIEIPHLKKIRSMNFLSGQTGWVTDREGDDLFLFRTVDGGRHWQESRTTLPSEWPDVREISFVDRNHGWIVLKHSRDDEIRLLATTDGGVVWLPVSIPTVRSATWWPNVVKFVSDKVGFVFSTEENDPQSGDFKSHKVFYTSDGGARWQKYSLPYSIFSCQTLDHDLICSADRKDSHFGILTVHPK